MFSVGGSLERLGKVREELRRAGRGEWAKRVEQAWGRLAGRLATEVWERRQTPLGRGWAGTDGRPLTLEQSGELRRSLTWSAGAGVVVVRLGGKSFGRHSVGSVQAYGGLSVAGFRGSAKRGRKAGAALARGGRVMVFKGRLGWRRRHAVLHAANPMLPEAGTVPPAWEEAFVREAREALKII